MNFVLYNSVVMISFVCCLSLAYQGGLSKLGHTRIGSLGLLIISLPFVTLSFPLSFKFNSARRSKKNAHFLKLYFIELFW